MANSTPKRAKQKPAKPRPDFPLFPHATGRWAKKIRGKLHYFGPWDDAAGALQRYLDQRDDLHAGRTPRAPAEGLTVRELANRFLTSKKILLDAREISMQTWKGSYLCCDRLIRAFGRNRLAVDLASDDFERLRAELAGLAPNTIKVEIQRIRSLFKYGYEAGLIDRPVRFGPTFRAPSRRVIEKARRANGERMFEAAEIQRLLDAPSVPMRAMILLGVNCGFGNNDCATLTFSSLDLENGWVNHPRPKTGMQRRCPLWPKTVQAVREAIAQRPDPRNEADRDVVFITGQRNRWVRPAAGNRQNWTDNVSIAFGRLVRRLELKRPGLSFYALRHTFETIGGESIDQVAVDAIMGHSRGDMASVYRERISDDRLRAVAEHVREWLFGDSGSQV